MNYAETRITPLLRGRSASDSNLNTLLGHHASPAKAQQNLDNGQKDVPDAGSEADKLKVIEVESEVAQSNSDDMMVFKPVTNNMGSRARGRHYNHTTIPSSYIATRMVQSDDGTRVVSPEPAESSSSSDRSFSPPPLNDSLDQPTSVCAVSSVAKQMKASRQQHGGQAGQGRRRVKLTSYKRPDSGDSNQASLKVMGVPAVAHAPTPVTPPTSQPIYVCQESESSSSDDDNDSLNEGGSYSCSRHAAHRSKKPVQQTVEKSVEPADTHSTHVNERKDEPKARTQGQSSSNVDTAEVPVTTSKPKIVGILKKTSSSSIESNQSVSSAGTVHGDRTPSKINSGSQTSTVSATKFQKRVRFIDQVATNNRHVRNALHSDSMWNNVLPNGFSTHHLPNSAFTPRMRVLLSSKATTIPPAVSGPPKRPTGPSNLNGITVHVPVASVESPPSPSHPPSKEQKSSQDSDEDTTSKEHDQNGAPSKNVVVNNGSSSGHSRNTTTSIEDNLTSQTSNGDDPSCAKSPSVSGKSLDMTPTDNEINEMWEQIKTCLEENKQSTSVPVQVYPFQMPAVNGMQRYGSANTREIATDTSALSLQREQSQATTSTVNSPSSTSHSHQQTGKANEQGSGTTVRLVHRQSSRNRPMRCQHQSARRHQSHTHHSHAATYPYSNQEQSNQGQGQAGQLRVYPAVQMSSREPELVVRAMSPINGRTG